MIEEHEDNFLMHIGKGHLDEPPGPGSGRWEWGSGDNPYQHDRTFYADVKRYEQKYNELYPGKKDKYHKESFMAEQFGITVPQYRVQKRNLDDTIRLHYAYEFVQMDKKGISKLEMSRRTGVPDTTIGNMIKQYEDGKMGRVIRLSEVLRESVDQAKVIDISKGVCNYLETTDTSLKAAVQRLEEEGYTKGSISFKQVATGKDTYYDILMAPGITLSDAGKIQNTDGIALPFRHSTDGGETYRSNSEPFVPIDSSRVFIRYGDEGGAQKDGVIELRPGVPELSLGGKGYAQVRIDVNDTHYLKGMAMYANENDIPPGYDIVFNTNKNRDVPVLGDKNNSILKPLKLDSDGNPDSLNPFGASVVRKTYTDENGVEHASAINIVGSGMSANEEGRWGEWSKELSSQFLSKQDISLINRQLNLSKAETEGRLEEIRSIPNPLVKQKMMLDLAEEADTKAAELKGAALPGQSTCVMLPVPDMDPKECYCRRFETGTEVIAIRFPLGTVAEIPVLKVNNNHPACAENETFKNSKDCIGISHVTAQQMSGADFDGDTCVVIPVNSNFKFKIEAAIKELVEFEPKIAYKVANPDDAPKINTQLEMGKIANLLADMQISGAEATADDVIRAVKFSMVVIDAEKHHLDWKKAEKDLDIAGLREKYRGSTTAGAATIVSKKSKKVEVEEREDFNPYRDINKETGEITYRQKLHKVRDPETGDWKKDPETGQPIRVPYKAYKAIRDPETGITIGWEQTTKDKTQEVSWLREVDDAYKLVGDRSNKIEVAYAEYSNSMKALANSIRKEAINIDTSTIPHPTSKTAFAAEVKSLQDKLKEVEMNSPLERAAQRRARYIIRDKVTEDPTIKSDKKRADEYKKLRFQALERGREEWGLSGKERRIQVTDKEWEAISSGAVAKSKVNKILMKMDKKRLTELAIPKSSRTQALSDTDKRRIENMLSNNVEPATIAKEFGVSVSTVFKIGTE